MKNKIKSLSFWLELSGIIVLIIDGISGIFEFQLYPSKVEDVIMTICVILISLGVVTKKNENDTKETSKKELIDEINNKNND